MSFVPLVQNCWRKISLVVSVISYMSYFASGRTFMQLASVKCQNQNKTLLNRKAFSPAEDDLYFESSEYTIGT